MIKQYLVTGLTIQNNMKAIKCLYLLMAKDLLTTYKMGWKTSYYQNTYDGKNDNDEPQHNIGDKGYGNEDKIRI